MHDQRQVAEAFLIESGADFQAAKVLFRSGCHARSIYMAQQSVEKILKASLALKGIFTTDHHLSPIFGRLFGAEFQRMEELEAAIRSLERLGARARFPLFHRDDLPIWVPSRQFQKRDATSALTGCELVYQELRAYLVEKEGLQPFSPEG